MASWTPTPWLGGLIERTCASPPVLVGHVLGGAIAARFAVNQSDRLARLVLVDSRPCEVPSDTEARADYDRLACGPGAKVVGRLMRELGVPRIPQDDLGRIAVRTSLIWGRHDRANRLRIAEAASARYGWPLHVIEDCADDPPRDRPEAFLEALHAALE